MKSEPIAVSKIIPFRPLTAASSAPTKRVEQPEDTRIIKESEPYDEKLKQALDETRNVSASRLDLTVLEGKQIRDTSGLIITIGEKIGKGGMAYVYEANSQLHGEVALKLIDPSQSEKKEVIRFWQEGKTTSELGHPNIVPVYCYGYDQTEKIMFIVMKLARGGTLEDYLKKKTIPLSRTDLIEVLGVLILISRALESIHRKHIVHRDVKPTNILLDGEPDINSDSAPSISKYIPLLADLGIAKKQGATQTNKGDIIGTPVYMSPEQAGCVDDEAGKTLKACPATDIHALGLILLELLTGKNPLQADTGPETIKRVMSRNSIQPPRVLNPKIHKDMDTLVTSMTMFDPRQRSPRTALEVAEELERFVSGNKKIWED